MGYIREELQAAKNHCVHVDVFREALMEHLSEKEADRVLYIAIDWGRYAELFSYDDSCKELNLENPD